MKTQKEVRDLSYILCPKILSCGDDLNSEYRNGFVNGYLEAQQELFTLEELSFAINRAYKEGFDDVEDEWRLGDVKKELIELIELIKSVRNEKST